MALVWIPSNMRTLTGGASRVTVAGRNLRELFDNLERQYPGFRKALIVDELVREDIAIAIDGDTYHQGLFQEIGPDSEVHIIPAIAGGSHLLAVPARRPPAICLVTCHPPRHMSS